MLGPGKGLRDDRARTVTVTFHPSYEGQYEDTLELTFQRKMTGSVVGEQFVITRSIRAVVGSPEDHERLKPKAPYVKPSAKVAFEHPKRIIKVVRPSTWSYTKWKVPLPQFPVPSDIAHAAFGPHAKTALKQFLPRLSLSSYSKFFQVLLWIEEEQIRYNTHSMLITPC